MLDSQVMANSLLSYVHLVFLISLLLLIIIGNLLVIIAYRTNQRLRTATYTFLVSLAVSDFLVGSVSLPLWIYFTFNWSAHEELKIFYTCFDIFSALASIYHLTAVTLERWVAICRPFYYITLSKRSYHISIAVAWLLALVVAALWPKYYTSEKNLDVAFKVYTLIIFLSGLIVPAILITLVNISIFKVAKALAKSPHHQQSFVNVENMTRNIKKERKTAITLVLVTALFCISWAPFFLMNLLSPYCDQCNSSMLGSTAFVYFVKWLHYSNSATNPLVYAFRDSEIRKTFTRFFRRLCRLLIIRGPRGALPEHDLSLNTMSHRRGTSLSVVKGFVK